MDRQQQPYLSLPRPIGSEPFHNEALEPNSAPFMNQRGDTQSQISAVYLQTPYSRTGYNPPPLGSEFSTGMGSVATTEPLSALSSASYLFLSSSSQHILPSSSSYQSTDFTPWHESPFSRVPNGNQYTFPALRPIHPASSIPIVTTMQSLIDPFSRAAYGNSFEEHSINLSTETSTYPVDSSPSPTSETTPWQTHRRLSQARKAPQKMHRCDVCSKEFPRPSALRTHMNSHKNLRPYKCEFPDCQKTFTVLSNARRHYRTHSERAPTSDSGDSEYRVSFDTVMTAPTSLGPPPRSSSESQGQAAFRLRWIQPNHAVRGRRSSGSATQLTSADFGTPAHDNDIQDPPMFL